MEQVVSPDLRFEVCPDVVYHGVGDELVLLNLVSQQYYGLDDMGARIWHSLVESGRVAATVDRICAEYEVERVQALHDIESMVGDFCAAGLMKAVN